MVDQTMNVTPIMATGLVLLLCFILCKVSNFLQYWIKFYMFAIWNAFLALLVIIVSLLSLRPGDSVNFWWWNFFSYCIHSNWLFGFTIKTLRSVDRLDSQKPYIIVSNHQTCMDQFVFLATRAPGRFTVLAKKSMKYYPFYGQALTCCDAIFIDRSSPAKTRETIERCVKYLNEKKGKLWVFPEGGRSHLPEIDMLPFKEGAFRVAVQAQVPIVPVVASGYTHMFHSSKYIFDKVDIVIDTMPDVPTVGLTEDDVPELTERVRNMMLERYHEISKRTSNIKQSSKT